MALFKDFFSSSRGKDESVPDPLEAQAGKVRGPETMPVKMNLEERMAFRRELLYETIRVSLSARGIAPHTYRFKVMRTDKRGHCFVVMLDMSPSFMASAAGELGAQKQTAALLINNAQNKYGLNVGGVYWRADDTLDVSVANWARPSYASSQPSSESMPLDALERTLPGVRPSNIDNNIDNNIDIYEKVSADDAASFEAAWQKDNDIEIGDRTYTTDLAPLGEPAHK